MSAAGPRVTCATCPHACSLAEGQLGLCQARRNVGGVVTCENYGRLTSVAVDPVEKKPLAEFHPGRARTRLYHRSRQCGGFHQG